MSLSMKNHSLFEKYRSVIVSFRDVKDRKDLLLEDSGEKYDGRGQIIIERGQFSETNLHGAVHDRAHFKIMKRGQPTS